MTIRATPFQRRPSRARGLWVALLPALLVNAVLITGIAAGLQALAPEPGPRSARPVKLVRIEKPEEKELEPEEPEPELSGQLVEVAPPDEQEIPKESDYLAEVDATVPEETKTAKVAVNPEILSNIYSTEQEMKAEDLMDLNVEEPSTGATVGNHRFDPATDGTLASLPSPWAVTNKQGLQSPTVASHADASLAGAPQNDSLDERTSDRLALNTKKFLYAQYLQRIRRLVNFWWNQNLDNLSSRTVLTKSRYRTVVNVILTSDGRLEFIAVTTESGSAALDAAVVDAFRMAGPYPAPPEGLIEKDGRVYLPDFGFDVNLGRGINRYNAVDPRAGVQFPGILKSPR